MARQRQKATYFASVWWSRLLATALRDLLVAPTEENKQYAKQLLGSSFRARRSARTPGGRLLSDDDVLLLDDAFGVGEYGRGKLSPPSKGGAYRYRTKGFSPQTEE